MPKPRRSSGSAVGKKAISAATGLFLTIFLIGHLAGNLLLLRGHGEYFNFYANSLNRVPFLIAVELLLIAGFAYHAYMGLCVYFENKSARPQEYEVKKWTGRDRSRKSWSSTTMHLSGSAVLLFLVLHIWHFKFGQTPVVLDGQIGSSLLQTATPGVSDTDISDYTRPTLQSTFLGGEQPRDLAWLVATEFKKPLIVGLYVISLLLVGLHLNHGVSSAFQSVGANRLGRKMLIGGRIFTIVLIGGFLLIPLWILFMWH